MVASAARSSGSRRSIKLLSSIAPRHSQRFDDLIESRFHVRAQKLEPVPAARGNRLEVAIEPRTQHVRSGTPPRGPARAGDHQSG